MLNYYKTIEGGFCDYHEFYSTVALWLPNGGKIVEIGCAYGESSVYLAEHLRDLDKQFELNLVDNLEYGQDAQRRSLLKHFKFLEVPVNLVIADSLAASRYFEDQSLDFVFIDGSHTYAAVKADIRMWAPKLNEGGLLAGHDYLMAPGVKQAVDEMFQGAVKVEETAKGYGVWHIHRRDMSRLSWTLV